MRVDSHIKKRETKYVKEKPQKIYTAYTFDFKALFYNAILMYMYPFRYTLIIHFVFYIVDL